MAKAPFVEVPKLKAMRAFSNILTTSAAFGLSLALFACSQNTGFGNPAPNSFPPPGAGPNGENGTLVPPSSASPFNAGSPQPASSQTPQVTPLSVDSLSLRLAYDGAASDLNKAKRILDFSVALKNPTNGALSVAKAAAFADGNAIADTRFSLSAPANQTSSVALFALRPTADLKKAKSVTVNFTDDSGKLLAVGTADLAQPAPVQITPLDDKHPAGGPTIDGIEITRVLDAARGPQYECTFALTNAGGAKISVSSFTVAPPKGESVKINLPIDLPARSTTGFITFLLPYHGKSLPDGKYSVTAFGGGGPIAAGSGPLL